MRFTYDCGMVRPPSIVEVPAYPATGATAFFAVAVTLAWWNGRDISPLVDSPAIARGEVWRLLTSALPHVNVLHLLFNLMWLWSLGTIVERVFGSWRIVALYAFLAVGSSAAEYALFRGGVGLSGVVYGLWAMLYVLSKRDGRFYGAVDAATNQLMVVWFFICIAMTAVGAMRVANVAHGVGALLGFLVGRWIVAGPRRRVAAGAGAVAACLLFVAGAVFARPAINLDFRGQAAMLDERGIEALEAGDPRRALPFYLEAVKKDPTYSNGWHNLGVTYDRLGEPDLADKAFKRAAELKAKEKPKGRQRLF